jgi:acyl carrier protein
VKHITNGLLYWCGRIDSQVKIRGMRVVLEHIESNIYTIQKQRPQYSNTLRDVKVVFDTGQNGPDTAQLTCILQLQPSSHDATANSSKDSTAVDTVPLLNLLATVLTPAEMPALIIPYYSEFPITSSGKLDRQALLTAFRKQQEAQQQPNANSATFNNHAEQTTVQQTSIRSQQICRAVAAALCNTIPNCTNLIQAWLNTSSSSSSGDNSKQSDTLACAQLGITSMQAVEIAHKLRNEHGIAIDATDLLQYDITLTQLVQKVETRGNMITYDTSTTESSIVASAATMQDIKRAHNDVSADNAAATITKRHKADTSNNSSSGTTDHVHYNMSVGRCGRGNSCIYSGVVSTESVNSVDISVNSDSSSRTQNTPVVKMQQQWSVPFSKCIDATPLVLLTHASTATSSTTAASNDGLVIIASHR